MGLAADLLAGVVLAVVITAIPLAICIIVELVSPRTRYPLKDRFPGIVFILFPPILAVLTIPPLRSIWYSLGIEPLLDVSGLGSIGVYFALQLARDFLNYWQHRFDHWAVWPIHAVHHSETNLHAANGYAHPFQIFSEFALITIPLSLISFGSVALPLAVTLSVSLQSMIIHSPIRVHLGPLRRLLVDSRFHRLHHSLETQHFDCNFGTVFSIWDQIFGTARFPSEDEWPKVGVEGLAPPRTLKSYLLLPIEVFRSSRSTPQ